MARPESADNFSRDSSPSCHSHFDFELPQKIVRPSRVLVCQVPHRLKRYVGGDIVMSSVIENVGEFRGIWLAHFVGNTSTITSGT